MNKIQALEIVKNSIPIQQNSVYDEILAKAVSLVEIKTRGFSYPEGISESKFDVSEYLKEFNIDKEQWLAENKELLRSETEALTEWLAPELIRLGHYKKSQNTDKSKKLKLLKLKSKSAQAQIELLKLKI